MRNIFNTTKEWLSILVYTTGWFAIVFGAVAAITHFNGNIRGIHDIGDGNAVYIAGEICTINTTMDRPVQKMRDDFEKCVEWYNHWIAELQD